MSKEFIPYEEASALKELGFDEACLANWVRESGEDIQLEIWNDEDTFYTPIETTKAPLYQQAFRWFREKYNILGKVRNLCTHTTKHQFYAEIVEPVTVSSYSIYDTYEEAELSCLRKLIEIVNQNKDE